MVLDSSGGVHADVYLIHADHLPTTHPHLQVRILEKEKEVVTSQFDRRRHELEHLLAATRAELDTTRADRDRWKARAEGSEVGQGAKGGKRALACQPLQYLQYREHPTLHA
jgi:hypothetical protein